MKNRIIVLLLLILFFSISINVSASELAENPTELSVSLEEVSLQHANQEVLIKTPSIQFENKRFIPLREVMERSGQNVSWNPLDKSIHIQQNQRLPLDTAAQVDHNFGSKLTFDAEIQSNAAIVIEDKPEQIMYEKNSYKKFFPASTQKIMTALIALENADLTDEVIVSENVTGVPYDSSKAYILPGDKLTLKQLLYALLLPSGNDAGVAVADYIAGSEREFVKMMNQKVKEIGAENTNFMNSHGYHHPNQYTTAYDLALIAHEVSKYPEFMEIIQTPYFKAVYQNNKGEQVTRHWSATNQLLKNKNLNLDGVVGGKTGFTDQSKHTIITFAEKNNHQYISVVLKGNAYPKYTDTINLLKKAFNVREAFLHKTTKTIKASYNVNHIYVNGAAIEHTGEYLVYNGTTFVTEKYLNQIVQMNKMITSMQPLLYFQYSQIFGMFPYNQRNTMTIVKLFKDSLIYEKQQFINEIEKKFVTLPDEEKDIPLIALVDQYLDFDPSIKL